MSRRLAQGIGDPPSRESRATVEAVVALGANLGDREETLREAVHATFYRDWTSPYATAYTGNEE